MIELKTEARKTEDSPTSLRNTGYLPAVFYGAKEESTPVKISEKDFKSLYQKAGESTVISVKYGDRNLDALIHDVQFDAVTDKPIHVDFYIIEAGKKLEVAVPISFVGESVAEKTLGGVLVKVMHEIEIKALPKDLPSEIEVNIAPLVDFNMQVRAEDIKLPEGVELVIDPQESIVLVQEPKEEEVEEESGEVDLDSIEVEEKGKKEESKEGEAEASTAESADAEKTE